MSNLRACRARHAAARDHSHRVKCRRYIFRGSGSVVIGLGLSAFFATGAFAAPAQVHPRPVIDSTQATFIVPPGSDGTWTLRLWSDRKLEGQSVGTTGTLTVPVPTTTNCHFQADVQVKRVGGTRHLYSGLRETVANCGSAPSPVTGPTGPGQTTGSSPGTQPGTVSNAGNASTPAVATNGAQLRAAPGGPQPVLTGADAGNGALPQTSPGASQLAYTGMESVPLSLIGLTMMVLGALLFTWSRRRQWRRRGQPLDEATSLLQSLPGRSTRAPI